MSQDLKKIYDDIFSPPAEKRRSSNRRGVPYSFKKEDFRKKIDTLYNEYYALNGSYEYDPKIYAEATENVVKGCTSNKDTLISVYKEYNSFIAHTYGIEILIIYPPIPISNTLERLMFIAKYLQDEKNSISDISDILWQSQRTIEKDIARLQGNDNDTLQVCGQKFIIHETDRSMGHLYFESTAHPFFLTCNLTQVITALEGLRIMSGQPGFEGYAVPMAKNIWRQLSDYGKERIFYVMENLLCRDTSWYASLGEEDEFSYKTESECCRSRDDILMYCLKGGDRRPCYIEYQNGDKSEFLMDVQVIQNTDAGWKVRVNGEELILERDKIIRSSFHKENMF